MLACGEWLEGNLLAPEAHRQYVFALPKLIRPFFRFHRRYLGEHCRLVAGFLRTGFKAMEPRGQPAFRIKARAPAAGCLGTADTESDRSTTPAGENSGKSSLAPAPPQAFHAPSKRPPLDLCDRTSYPSSPSRLAVQAQLVSSRV
jgi:hypothetical protein